MTQIKNLMTKNVEYIDPDASIAQAAAVMKNHQTGFLPVGEDNKLVGTLTRS